MIAAVLAGSLGGCGGGDGELAAAIGEGLAGLSCDTAALGGEGRLPTAEEVLAYAKTYVGEVGVYDDDMQFTVERTNVNLIMADNGAITFDGAAVELRSLCILTGDHPALYAHWGTRTVVGAGAVYENHMDFFADGFFSGVVGGKVYRSEAK